jgi:division protein CdvB (Snf7/Vps24/ESCRT-III family)
LTNFSENWAKQQKDGLGKRTKEAVRGPRPVRPQIQKATRELRLEIGKLENTSGRLKQKEETIFRRTVNAVQTHNEQTGKAYANELAEVRKMQRMVTQSKVALEQVSTRLETVTDMGDFAATLAPAIGVVRNVRKSLSTSMPDAQSALGEVGEVFNSMMADVGQLSGFGFSLGETSEDAEKILSEATTVAENRMSKDFPTVPGASESIFNS